MPSTKRHNLSCLPGFCKCNPTSGFLERIFVNLISTFMDREVVSYRHSAQKNLPPDQEQQKNHHYPTGGVWGR